MKDACEPCLERARLVGILAPEIARWFAADARERGRRSGDRPRRPAVLGLPDDELIAAVCSKRSASRVREELAAGAPRDLVRACAAVGVAASCPHGELYPPRLLHLDDPPAAIFVAGRVETLAVLSGGPAVAIVGTRRPSAYGLEMARALGRGVAMAGVPVISGLALGVDAAAHHGALAGGGAPPVAVLACGAERPYPRSHRALHDRVCERGAVLSELPPGTEPYRWAFPARNRVMAALADAVVVVEAADPSGSLITADLALDLGRAVGAVPGQATSRQAAGANRLLQEGCAVVLRAADVLSAVGVESPADPGQPAVPEDLRALLDALEAGEGAAAVGARTGLPASVVRAGLARLELLGAVRRDGIGGYVRALD